MTKISVDIGCRPGAGAADIRDGFTHRRATARTKFGRCGSFAMLVAGAVLCASLAVTTTVDTADARGFGGHGYGGHGYAATVMADTEVTAMAAPEAAAMVATEATATAATEATATAAMAAATTDATATPGRVPSLRASARPCGA